METKENKEKVIFKDLSYLLIGLAYETSNLLGEGLPEKDYKEAFSQLLKKANIRYIKEWYCPIKIDDKIITRRYFDFLVEDKIIIEFKVGNRGYHSAYRQLMDYLKTSKYRLGMIIRFTLDGVKFKRILNS